NAEMAVSANVPSALRTPAKLVLSAMVGKVRVPDPMTAMMARKIGANGGLPYRWDPKYPARIGVMPREGGNGDVRWFEVEPCYGYSMSADDGANPGGSVFKHDFHTGSRQERAFGEGRQPGEFVFVPCHDDAAEDDGVLMGFVFDPATQRSDLTLLDAGTLETVA